MDNSPGEISMFFKEKKRVKLKRVIDSNFFSCMSDRIDDLPDVLRAPCSGMQLPAQPPTCGGISFASKPPRLMLRLGSGNLNCLVHIPRLFLSLECVIACSNHVLQFSRRAPYPQDATACIALFMQWR